MNGILPHLHRHLFLLILLKARYTEDYNALYFLYELKNNVRLLFFVNMHLILAKEYYLPK